MKINNERRFFGMLGFAMRAGRILLGTDTVCDSLKRGNVKLVIISDGASDGAKKKIFRKCDFYGINAVSVDASPEAFGEALGKPYAPVVIGIADEGFARELIGTLDGSANKTEDTE